MEGAGSLNDSLEQSHSLRIIHLDLIKASISVARHWLLEFVVVVAIILTEWNPRKGLGPLDILASYVLGCSRLKRADGE